MPFAGYDINAKYTEPWVTAIGKFMVNFGSIELETFLWIDKFSSDTVLKELVLEMPLSRRTAVIRRLLDDLQLSKKLLNDSRSAWGQAEKLAQLRNEIAHTPIVFGWYGKEEKRPPDYVGGLNFRKIKGKAPRTVPLLEYKEVLEGVDHVVSVAQRLHASREAIAAPAGEA